ncbi:MAG: DUF4388 domain-containing protein [Caldisericaceae bacterium]
MALQGNLSDFKLEEVIQTISTGNKSGKLGITGKMGEYGIYFVNGKIIHAFGPFSIGEDAIKDVFIETEGNFIFKQNLIMPPQTIKTDATSIIMDGIMLREELKDILLLFNRQTVISTSQATFNGDMNVSNEEWKILSMVVKGMIPEEIIEQTNLSFISFIKTLKVLLEKNLVKLGG